MTARLQPGTCRIGDISAVAVTRAGDFILILLSRDRLNPKMGDYMVDKQTLDVVFGARDRPVDILAKVLGSSQAETAMAALAEAGLVCVPRNPTDEMLEAGWAPVHAENAAETWREMIEAAPG